MSLTFKEVDQVLRIIEEFPADEVRFEYGDLKVHVRRAGSGAARTHVAAPVPQASASNGGEAGERRLPAAASAGRPPEAADPAREGLVAVTSPMTGVFYAAPAPGAEPFVAAGQQVAVGDDLCIVEVMKIMNLIKAPCAGVVVEIAVENAQTVSGGGAIMWIRPEGARR